MDAGIHELSVGRADLVSGVSMGAHETNQPKTAVMRTVTIMLLVGGLVACQDRAHVQPQVQKQDTVKRDSLAPITKKDRDKLRSLEIVIDTTK